jgi:biotin carboxylase
VTEHERMLSERLQLAVYGPTPEAAALGSKTGSRRVARQAGVAVLPGEEDLRSIDDLDGAVERLRSAGAVAAVAKLNNGFSGQGNVILDIGGEKGSVVDGPTVFCATEESWPSFIAKMGAEGAIVEELVRRPGTVSPSVQVRIAPSGAVEVVSTHDQILGGPENQVYLGCRFPASLEYRLLIQEQAVWVAEVLAAEGVMGSFGIDFIVLPDGEVYLSEINLRMGGTTHPYWMARLATGATYDVDTGDLVSGGQRRCYVASDNLKAEALKGRSPADVITEIRRRGWAFDPERGTGATVHLLGALREHGKMGVTCIGATMDEAESLFDEVTTVLTGGQPS